MDHDRLGDRRLIRTASARVRGRRVRLLERTPAGA